MLNILKFLLPNIVKKSLETTPNKSEIEDFDYNPTPNVGRVYEDGANVSLYEGLSEIIPNFDVELIKSVEQLVYSDSVISQAVDNIVLLSNTELEWVVEGVSESRKQEIINFCDAELNKWYAISEYPNDKQTLLANLFVQVATSGCISTEAELFLDPYEIRALHLIPIYYLSINWDSENRNYEFVQKTSNTKIQNVLNRFTYSYKPLYSLPDSVFPVAPLIASLMAVRIERRLFDKLAMVIDKMPLTGVLSALIPKPSRQQGQDNNAYTAYTNRILQKVSQHIKKNFMKSGVMVGWKDGHEFQHTQVVQNLDGVKTLKQISDAEKMRGTGQNPLLFGENYSVTESMADFVLQLNEAKITSIQELVASCVVHYMKKALAFEGLTSEGLILSARFKSAFPENEKVKAETGKITAETDKVKIETWLPLYQKRMIDKDVASDKIGVELADLPEPEPTKDKNNTDSNHTALFNSVVNTEHPYHDVVGEFPYDLAHQQQSILQLLESVSTLEESYEDLNMKKLRKNLDKYLKKYLRQTHKNYKKAVNQITDIILQTLTGLPKEATPTQVEKAILEAIKDNWRDVFSANQAKFTEKIIKEAYRAFRTDMGVISTGDVPEATFNVDDRRTQEYHIKNDNLYLGKFMQDEDVKKAINKFINNEYVRDGRPMLDKDGIKKFREEFPDALNQKDWKIAQIISTTVNRMRNDATVLYMNQAKVTTYEIRGITDRLQCVYCQALQGTQFSVVEQVKHIQDRNKLNPEDTPKKYPFITSVPIAEVRKMTPKQLQAKNFSSPPFHPKCRDVVVMV